MNKPNNFTPAEWVTKAQIDIMRDPVFCAFCAVLSCGDLRYSKTLPTAATDGWNITFNPDFMAGLALPEVRFVMLHEALHIAYQHLHVWQSLWKRDARGANIAADMVINTALMQADAGRGFIKCPAIGVQPDLRYADMSVQQVYDLMKQEGAPEPQGGDGFDEHQWEDAQQGEATQAERTEAIKQAIRQGEVVRQRSARGSGTGEGVFGDLLNPKVDWRAALRAFIRDQCLGRDESTWRKPSRRYLSDDVYMPSMISERLDEVVIGFDTSGSCFGTAEMTRFVTEVTALIAEVCPARTHVVYWDTEVVAHQEFLDGQFAVASLKPQGGGGTDGSVLFDYLRKKKINPTVVVQLSDGYVGDWGRTDWPTLWALTEKSNRAPYGTTVYL